MQYELKVQNLKTKSDLDLFTFFLINNKKF